MSIPKTGSLIAGKYRLEAPLGEGGMGAVFRARHELMDKAVALKWLKPGYRDDTRAEDRFLQEARAAARIHHPNVVDVYDVGRHDGGLYMVMELLEGQDFARVLEAGQMPFPVALRHLLSAMRGVVAAHAAGITHRDIKPENIFVAYDAHYTHGIAKILDFGISKLHDDSHIGRTGPGVAMGTPHYMSYEQMAGATDIDQRTDIYAFGVLLYRMLTGTMPFDGATPTAIMVARIHGNVRSPRELRPALPAALDSVVMKAMALKREDRQATLVELITQIEKSGALELADEWNAPRAGVAPAVTTLPQPGHPAARHMTPQLATAPNATHSRIGLPGRASVWSLTAGGLVVIALVALAVVLRSGSTARAPAALPGQRMPTRDSAPAHVSPVYPAPERPLPAASGEPRVGNDDAINIPTSPALTTTPNTTPGVAEKPQTLRRAGKPLVRPDAGVVAARRATTSVVAVEEPPTTAVSEPPASPAPAPAAAPAAVTPSHRSGNLRKEDL